MRKIMIGVLCVFLAVVVLSAMKAIWLVTAIATVAFVLMLAFELKRNGVVKYMKGAARAVTKATIKKNPQAIYEAEELAFREGMANLKTAIEVQYATLKSLEGQFSKERTAAEQLRKDVISISKTNPDLAKAKAVSVVTKDAFVKKAGGLIEEHRAKYAAIVERRDIYKAEMETRLASMKASSALSATLNAEHEALAPIYDGSQEWTVDDSESMLEDSVNESEARNSSFSVPSSSINGDDALRGILASAETE